MEDKQTERGAARSQALASAIAPASCCVLPLLFVSLGQRVWIGALTALAPYQPIFLAIATASIIAGFWTMFRRKAAACSGPDGGTAASRTATRVALWIGLLFSSSPGLSSGG